jgi:hypothetical protein
MPTVYSPPVSTYVPIATITLAAAESEIVFSSIPATYRDLVLIATNQGLTGPVNTRSGYLELNDTGGTSVRMLGVSSGTISSTRSDIDVPFDDNLKGVFIINIMDYSATDKHKTVLIRANRENELAGAYAGRVAITDAVTSVHLVSPDSGVDEFAIGSTFSLYGIAG